MIGFSNNDDKAGGAETGTATTTTTLDVVFEPQKETKNTIRFVELDYDGDKPPKVGLIYVPKVTLNEMGWQTGKQLVLTLKLADHG